MLEFELLKSLALRMEVYAAHSSLNLVEADVIEPFEAST